MALEYLTPEQVSQFENNGYLLLPGFLSSEEVARLLRRSKELLSEFDIKDHPLTRFTTSEDESADDAHVGDDYFLDSGDKIRYFLEQDAVVDGKLNRDKEQAVNKIGHALHELDPDFRKITLGNPRLRALAKDLAFHRDPAVLQSMVICKQPRIGGKVPEHNDSTFLYTSPPTALGFWFALENCTASNGALSFLPGSHRTTPIAKRFVRLPQGGTGFEDLSQSTEAVPKKNEDYRLEPCDAGTLVLIHGSILHKSGRNESDLTRFAYTFHMIESEPYATYDKKNWLQPTSEMPFSKLLA